MKKYLTKSGDYWDSIAKENLGSSKYTDKLMKANAKYLELEKFPAGIELVLPEIEQKVRSKPPWR